MDIDRPMSTPLPVINLSTATFECSYGRGCDGLCCKNSEPPVTGDEQALVAANLPRILPLLRPEARALIEREGFLGEPHPDDGNPMLRVADDWCVFFNQGCVLHKLGAAQGDAHALKPIACSLFPLQQNDDGDWYVRQWGVENEDWDLFCLNPANARMPAAESLRVELALAALDTLGLALNN